MRDYEQFDITKKKKDLFIPTKRPGCLAIFIVWGGLFLLSCIPTALMIYVAYHFIRMFW